MNHRGRKCFGGFLALALCYVSIGFIGVQVNSNGANKQPIQENNEWIANGKNWFDRQACRWIGICGVVHLNQNGWTWDGAQHDIPRTRPDRSAWWTSGSEDPLSWSKEERSLREIPQYVLDYAPYVHLYSGEQFWPCDLGNHLVHTSPRLNYTKILDLEYDRNLTNLHELNDYRGSVYGKYMYLQSDDNVEERPKWLGGADNIPSSLKVDAGNDDEVPWPGDDDSESTEQQKPMVGQQSLEDAPGIGWPWPWSSLTPSTNGRCGGNSGFTCKASKFGRCCSIYGWCGEGEAYCGSPCDSVAGECNDPFELNPKPHTELRRRLLNPGGAEPEPIPAGKSSAPAILVVVPKGDGVLDAFWFFFYSFNLGQKVMGIRFGNHVGDWEHTLIRFKDGKPENVFLSEHNFGDAYAWHALEKYIPNPDDSGTMIGSWSNHTAAKLAKRPVVYSAEGSHAMYATPGLHPYVLPYGLLHDVTDRGPLWDPSLNVHSYTYDPEEHTVRASTLNPKSPIGWFDYAGHWGDKYYPLSDSRQYRLFGQYHYVNGPSGPRFKNLGRKKVCQKKKGECRIRHWLEDSRAKRFPPEEDVEEGGLPGGNSTDEA